MRIYNFLIAGAVAMLVSREYRRQCLGNRLHRRVRLSNKLHERLDDVVVTEVADSLDGCGAQHCVAEQRHHAARDARVAEPRERLNRRKREEELASLRDAQ